MDSGDGEEPRRGVKVCRKLVVVVGFCRWRGTQSRGMERLDQESNVFRQLQVSRSSALGRWGRRGVWIMRS